ncbi:Hypothetical predicted protein [Podarcis lilfordi]|uniref:Uncharacterized protein n=1 Tax=Podarcis lilfordi TaxID=74358 RepID=A0AA35KK65_9SAUR|nr:Hypothetical predicted protein [Podarcis lilfordi]
MAGSAGPLRAAGRRRAQAAAEATAAEAATPASSSPRPALLDGAQPLKEAAAAGSSNLEAVILRI